MSNRYPVDALRSVLVAVAVICLVPVLQAAQAAMPHTPPDLQGVTVITAVQARDLMAKGVLIVDTRVASEYVEHHIKGAVSIPYKERSAKSTNFDPRLDRFDLTKLPADKSTPVIFYCNAGECWRSYKSSKAALEAGYTKIYWLRGGIPEWRDRGFAVE